MKEVFLITMLYDFYGELLTQKQKNVIEMYHLDDLSLNEIALEHNCSRQAVRDLIKRSENILYEYEQKLNLVKKYLENKKIFEKKITELDVLLGEYNLDTNDRYIEVKNSLLEIFE